MDKQTQNKFNKDLILRERLAIERTSMAIDTTLLAFIRTSLYFSIAGISLNKFFSIRYGVFIEISFWIASLVILVLGVINFSKQKRRLKENEKHVGDFKLDWEKETTN
jgi:putative membrane protein